ncbi:MAG: hypothetical protein ACQETL_17480 [Bacteroidota bacterium]
MSDSVLDIKKDNKLGQLKAILYLLQTNLEDFKDEVDSSYELLKVGERTALSKKIEQKIDNPINDIFEFSSKIDLQVNQIIDKVIRSFFKKNAKIIDRAFKTKESLNDLHYSIILKDDNLDNRTKLFSFLDNFDLMDISQKHPVYFQFIPKKLIDKINYNEEIKFE